MARNWEMVRGGVKIVAPIPDTLNEWLEVREMLSGMVDACTIEIQRRFDAGEKVQSCSAKSSTPPSTI